MAPLRAPTIRSVPEIVSAKLWRAPVRTFSTPSSSITENAIASTVSEAVSARLRKRLQGEAGNDHAAALRSATAMSSSRSTRSKRLPSSSSWLTMIRLAPAAGDLGKEQVEEGQLPVAVERRGRLVGDDQLRRRR